jgi:levansucrase
LLSEVSNRLGLSPWSAQHVAGVTGGKCGVIPVVRLDDIVDVLPGFQLWDCWCVETVDGHTVAIDGWSLWVIMCAPRSVHPDLRHDVARLRLMREKDGVWDDCGYLFPDDLNPGSREWAGSTIFDEKNQNLTVYFTVTGRRSEPSRTYEQRLFECTGKLVFENGRPSTTGWKAPLENVIADGKDYLIVDQHEGAPGFIKGFRDPFHFRDPVDDQRYLLFTASLKQSESPFNGAIGVAVADAAAETGWTLLPPLVSADGLNNELERPMMRHFDGRYYLFWSTQRRTFAPDGPNGPNGLYGMVADAVLGPYLPINGTGLVAANPDEEPFQTYSWWVSDSFEVTGFVDLWGLEGRDIAADPALAVRQFGGVPAPRFTLWLDGDRAGICDS